MTNYPGQRTCGHTRDATSPARCEDCRKRDREAFHVRLRWRQRLLKENPEIRPHGVYSTYNMWGCRCDSCREAGRTHRYAYPRRRGVDAVLSDGVFGKRQSQTPAFGREWLDASATP